MTTSTNFNYSDIFENISNSLYNNIDYYSTKLHNIIVEISNLKDNITHLRKRIINLEDSEKENKKEIKKLKDEFDLIKINL